MTGCRNEDCNSYEYFFPTLVGIYLKKFTLNFPFSHFSTNVLIIVHLYISVFKLKGERVSEKRNEHFSKVNKVT